MCCLHCAGPMADMCRFFSEDVLHVPLAVYVLRLLFLYQNIQSRVVLLFTQTVLSRQAAFIAYICLLRDGRFLVVKQLVASVQRDFIKGGRLGAT